MSNKLLGATLLVVGTSIGGGILALPMATAAGGYIPSSLLMIGTWMLMSLGAYYLLEVNLSCKDGSNLISMAKITLGPIGETLTWGVYLLLLYSLLCAFIAGGADALEGIASRANLTHIPHTLFPLLFTGVFIIVIIQRMLIIDWVNRCLMLIKFASLFGLIGLVLPHVQGPKLTAGHWPMIKTAIMPTITSFGFAIIIPTLRSYLNSDEKALKKTIIIGSLIPLICYLSWDLVVQGTLTISGQLGLTHIAHAPQPIAHLVQALSSQLHSQNVGNLVTVFTTLAVTTSFLGVSLAMIDFLADGFKLKKTGYQRYVLLAITYLPPLLIIWINPNIFIQALSWAGVICVMLLILLPALMAFSIRYKKPTNTQQKMDVHKLLLITTIIISSLLSIYGVYQVLY